MTINSVSFDSLHTSRKYKIKSIRRPRNHCVRKVTDDDLLGRTQTVLETGKIQEYIRGKTILVTGGAGSIGAEICRQVLAYGCKLLIAFDIHENGLFELDAGLRKQFDPNRYVIAVGSIRDAGRLSEIFLKYAVDIVFHTAAYKHVPMMESHPTEAIKNNIFGTINTAQAAVMFGADHFILISTDKAVNCTSVMGATKRISEMIVQSLNVGSNKTKMAVVRFGNVLGSSGSVLTTFKNQIKDGGPVTVTHPDIERYFMTIKEAVQLVLQAVLMTNDGEVFVLDMGSPIKITDLANALIRQSGLVPGKDIRVVFTGLRPGEKMSEDLYLKSEIVSETVNSKIFVCKPACLDDSFMEKIDALKEKIESGTVVEDQVLLAELLSMTEGAGKMR